MNTTSNSPNLSCGEERRREAVRAASLFGVDYVEVADEQQLTLNVFFLGKAPPTIMPANVVLSGGRRTRDVHITSMKVKRQPDPTLDDYLEVHVDKAGDFSTYTISFVEAENGQPTGRPMSGFDPRYSQVEFSFKASCPTDLDCKQPCSCPPPQRSQPDIDYLAKDYESFRELVLDRLSLIMPQWMETHAPDLGITLVELLAYVGDYLSYYQDAVATEAYLGTARQRISVRRHARLVDYAMHDGCNARAWLTLWTDSDQQFDPAQVYFTTAYPGAPVDNHILTPANFIGVDAASYEVFQPLYWNGSGNINIVAAHSEIHFYTWGDCQCCLPIGSTAATLLDSWVDAADTRTPANPETAKPGKSTKIQTAAAGAPASEGPPGKVRSLQLKVGDIVIFEEVLGPKTGQASDRDPTHRQAVRLTKVTKGADPLYGEKPFGVPVVEIEWASEDGLTFPLCISSQQPPPGCGCLENVSVARGNIVLVDHGSSTVEVVGTVPTQSATPQCPKCCEPAGVAIMPGRFRPVLRQQPLTCSQLLPPPCSAADFTRQDPRQALPQVSLTSVPPAPDCAQAADPKQPPPPCTIPPLFTFDDIANPLGVAKALHGVATANLQFLFAQLTPATQKALAAWDPTSPLDPKLAAALVADLTALLESWSVTRDLLASGPGDRDFVVEEDNEGMGHLRFGDGASGRQPDAGTLFRANYRVGNGSSGNVGAEAIAYIVLRSETLSDVDLRPRNPLPSSGGTDPEPIEDVKLFAPYAFRSQLEWAITAADYGSLAADNQRRLEARAALEAEDAAACTAAFTRLQAAKGALRWTGSWYTAQVAVDPVGSETAPPELLHELTLFLSPYRSMGCDLMVGPAQYVPLKVSITVCVLPNYLRGHVEAAVLAALSNRALPDGRRGFFHPDNLSFGDGVSVSRLLTAVQAIPGVQNAMVTELERFEASEPVSGDEPGEELPLNSLLSLGPFEIAQLDNDPNYPEHGVLVLDVRGGR